MEFEIKNLWVCSVSCREHFDPGGGMREKIRSSREGVPPDISHQLSYPPQELSGRRLEDHYSESDILHSLYWFSVSVQNIEKHSSQELF